jgi:hypothetical protein
MNDFIDFFARDPRPDKLSGMFERARSQTASGSHLRNFVLIEGFHLLIGNSF